MTLAPQTLAHRNSHGPPHHRASDPPTHARTHALDSLRSSAHYDSNPLCLKPTIPQAHYPMCPGCPLQSYSTTGRGPSSSREPPNTPRLRTGMGVLAWGLLQKQSSRLIASGPWHGSPPPRCTMRKDTFVTTKSHVLADRTIRSGYSEYFLVSTSLHFSLCGTASP